MPGKGDTRRPESKPGLYDKGYERTFTKPRYVICPGEVISRSDGQIHFIGRGQLASLYGLAPGEYRVVGAIRGQELRPGEIALRPRYDGKYRKANGSPNA